MEQIKITSYGFGVCNGYVGILNDFGELQNFIPSQQLCLVVRFMPDRDQLEQIIRQLSPLLLIFPPVSPYSHYMTLVWGSSVPIIAINGVVKLRSNDQIFIDLEKSTLFRVDGYELELLKTQYQEISTISNYASNELFSEIIQIYGEVEQGSDFGKAFKNGAQAIGILKAELFETGNPGAFDFEVIRQKLAGLDTASPPLIRFFDFELRPDNNYPSSLGFRGVRILEIDDSWLNRFLELIDRLELVNLIVILPMIVDVKEIIHFKKLLGNRSVKVGVTIETPAAALSVRQIIEHVDFVEIGLNDLSQYTMAWDRNRLADSRLPITKIAEPVAQLIEMVAKCCNEMTIPYTLGLDLRPSQTLAKQIISLGVRSISCHCNLVARWRSVLSAL